MVRACIQVVSGSKLRQAATYAAEFHAGGMLYESQSIATFQKHAISAISRLPWGKPRFV
jgi:hypothetical protein